jgi:hypothetical protein
MTTPIGTPDPRLLSLLADRWREALRIGFGAR